jgi:hypothetical protein
VESGEWRVESGEWRVESGEGRGERGEGRGERGEGRGEGGCGHTGRLTLDSPIASVEKWGLVWRGSNPFSSRVECHPAKIKLPVGHTLYSIAVAAP